jgi:predicted RNase H-like nuclease (RuvC/YqgF family)
VCVFLVQLKSDSGEEYTWIENFVFVLNLESTPDRHDDAVDSHSQMQSYQQEITQLRNNLEQKQNQIDQLKHQLQK